MSVFAENIAIAHGESAEAFVRGHWSKHYLVAVIAGRMRELRQDVYLDLENQDTNDFFHSHAAVEGPRTKKRVLNSRKNTNGLLPQRIVEVRITGTQLRNYPNVSARSALNRFAAHGGASSPN